GGALERALDAVPSTRGQPARGGRARRRRAHQGGARHAARLLPGPLRGFRGAPGPPRSGPPRPPRARLSGRGQDRPLPGPGRPAPVAAGTRGADPVGAPEAALFPVLGDDPGVRPRPHLPDLSPAAPRGTFPHDPATTNRPSGWVGTMARPGR